MPTIPTKDRFGLVNPLVVPYGPDAEARDVEQPIHTVMPKDRLAVAEPTAFIVPNFSEREGQEPRVHDVNDPTPTVTGRGAGNLIEPIVIDVNHGDVGRRGIGAQSVEVPLGALTTNKGKAIADPILIDVNHSGDENRSQSVDEPLRTVTTKRGKGLAEPVTVQIDQKSGGFGSRSIDAPVPTIVTKQNLALAEPVLRAIEAGEIDPRRLVSINGVLWMLDIRFRMLNNDELARAMGFSDEEAVYEFVGTKSQVTKQIGNAVCVNLAAAR